MVVMWSIQQGLIPSKILSVKIAVSIVATNDGLNNTKLVSVLIVSYSTGTFDNIKEELYIRLLVLL